MLCVPLKFPRFTAVSQRLEHKSGSVCKQTAESWENTPAKNDWICACMFTEASKNGICHKTRLQMLLRLSLAWVERVCFRSLGAGSSKQYCISGHKSAIQGFSKVESFAVAQS